MQSDFEDTTRVQVAMSTMSLQDVMKMKTILKVMITSPKITYMMMMMSRSSNKVVVTYCQNNAKG